MDGAAPRVVISAGEPSGDLHGASLLRELLSLHPSLQIAAVAGPQMRLFPIDLIFPMEELQVMGFLDVAASLPKIARLFFRLRKQILSLNPKAVLCIDYPGFHLRLEQSLRKKGYRGKLIHFICPTVWAWNQKRIPKMAQTLDLLLTLLPFEPACFAKTPLKTLYVGHPLTQAVLPRKEAREHLLALFPGSRETEVERNLPLQLKTALQMQAMDPKLEIALSIASQKLKPLIQTLVGKSPVILIPPEQNRTLMQRAHLALATSGTVVLELALCETPAIVNFAIRPLDLFIAQKILRIDLPFYSLPNIIAHKEVYPELFGPRLTENTFFTHAQKLWFDEEARGECQKRCREVRDLLGDFNASRGAAEAVSKIMTDAGS